jgi:hypothetical protein
MLYKTKALQKSSCDLLTLAYSKKNFYIFNPSEKETFKINEQLECTISKQASLML